MEHKFGTQHDTTTLNRRTLVNKNWWFNKGSFYLIQSIIIEKFTLRRKALYVKFNDRNSFSLDDDFCSRERDTALFR
jgi:hypothetical protein